MNSFRNTNPCILSISVSSSSKSNLEFGEGVDQIKVFLVTIKCPLFFAREFLLAFCFGAKSWFFRDDFQLILLLSYKIYLYHPYQIIFLIIIVADNIVLDTRMGMLSSLMGRLLATTSAVIIAAAAAASAESKCHEGSLSSSSSPSSLPDCGEIIMLEDFAGPIHQWNEMNDPGTYCIHNVHPVLI